MTQPDRSSEPHVSPDELRAALTPRGRSRPSPVVSDVMTKERGPAWEWTTELSDGDQAELLELRDAVAAQRTHMEALEADLAEARAAARESREALSAFAAASLPWQRRALRRELSERGLL
jgi:hypothetical protein